MKKITKMINRNKCWLTGEEDLEELYCFTDFPVHMIADKNGSVKEDACMDLKFCISKKSGAVQISQLVPQHVLYKDAHFQTAHSGVWQEHNKELAKEIEALGVQSVFEIGGGTGILERAYAQFSVKGGG